MPTHVTKLKTTIIMTPVISTVFGWLAVLLLKLIGWRIIDDKPQDDKYIIIAAPHTSNWDFVLFLLVAFSKGFDAHWMGKDALFPKLIKPFVIWLGGIPIDRSKANNAVEQMVEYFSSVDKLAVLITPEGTRKKVERWKTGFYHIALQANVPIYCAYIDAPTRTISFGEKFIPSGNLEQDMAAMQYSYIGKLGINPEYT
ncbi:MAG: 1-acyl-sn-glycerol-3-phosphate acyltransferase [Oceanicoccus sp.]|jgi:1-acyl-sn-glycerol-3-phosphate acyltransferase